MTIRGIAKSIIPALILALLFTTSETFAASEWIVDKTDKKYSYNNMVSDIKQLQKKYGDRLTVTMHGRTADNRDIYCIRLGSEEAKNQILVTAGMHGREYINCQVVMREIEYYLRAWNRGTVEDEVYKDILEDTAIYFMPMTNPDGATISQYGPNKISKKSVRKKLKKMGKYYGYYYWKANARGVDINRNFESGWKKNVRDLKKKPFSENYCGSKPNSEIETKAVLSVYKSLTNCKAVINMHTLGRVYYWGAVKSRMKAEKRLTKIVKEQTGYSPIQENGKGDGDLEHYFRNIAKVPYVCIENGIGSFPMSHKQFNGIYKKNVYIPILTAYEFR